MSTQSLTTVLKMSTIIGDLGNCEIPGDPRKCLNAKEDNPAERYRVLKIQEKE